MGRSAPASGRDSIPPMIRSRKQRLRADTPNLQAVPETSMEQFVGLDVSQEFTHVCVVDHSGEKVWQGKCASTPEAIAEVIKGKAPGATRIGLETGPLSTWH